MRFLLRTCLTMVTQSTEEDEWALGFPPRIMSGFSTSEKRNRGKSKAHDILLKAKKMNEGQLAGGGPFVRKRHTLVAPVWVH